MTAASASGSGFTPRLTGAPPAPSTSSKVFVCCPPPHDASARQRQAASSRPAPAGKNTLRAIEQNTCRLRVTVLEKLPAVQEDRHGAVVHQLDLHHLAEAAG